MQVQQLLIHEVKLLTPRIFRDQRGFFSETHNCNALVAAGIDAEFVQDNHSLSRAKSVVRGLHFQAPPKAQGKLVRITRGAIFDVAVDIRKSSPTCGRHVTAVLSAENWSQLWVPVGFAHGFCTLEPDTEVLYKVTDYYAPECDRGLAWDDPDLALPGLSRPEPPFCRTRTDATRGSRACSRHSRKIDRWAPTVREKDAWFVQPWLGSPLLMATGGAREPQPRPPPRQPLRSHCGATTAPHRIMDRGRFPPSSVRSRCSSNCQTRAARPLA